MTQDIHATDPRIPEELIQAIRQDDCILLVGSGLCRYVRTPTGGSPPVCWKDTLRGLITVCKKNRHINQFQKKELDTLVSSGSLLEAGSKLQDYLRAKDESQFLLSKRLEEVLLCNLTEVGHIYLLLAQIPFCGYCTISYDRFIEDAYIQVYKHRPSTFNLTSIEDVRQEYLARKSKSSKHKFVLKLLGDVDHPTSLNLGDRYLQDWSGQNVEKAKALEDIFSDSPILLIGFEPGDPDLVGLLANKIIFDLSSESHGYYILIEKKADLYPIKGKLRTILYESKTKIDDFDLVSILESILRSLGVEPVIGERTLSPTKQEAAKNTKNASILAPQKTGLVHIFISWAQEDELQKQELLKHLNSLVSIGTISVWAGEFSYGIGKNKQVAENLEKAEIFLPLVSADYFKDKDCERELEEAVARYSNDNIRLIPVLLRTCPWQPYFRDIDLPPVLPRNAVSVMEGPKPDKAYTEIVETIAQVVEELRTGSLREQKSS